MKINWKVRCRNKVWVLTMASALVSIIYQIHEIVGIAPVIPREQVMDIVTTVLTIFALLGIVVDPTTDGVEDSELAMTYCTDEEEPKG